MKYKKHITGNKSINEAIVSPGNVKFCCKDLNYSIPIKNLSHINELWNEDNFKEINLPIIVDKLSEKELDLIDFGDDLRILDMPIKFPKSNYRLPKEIEFLEERIKKIAYYERKINKNIEDYYCYITIDRRNIEKEKTTRKGGVHLDGFQGARLESLLPIDHSYLISTNNPTIFYNQSFEVMNYWDKSCHNYFEGFELQKDTNKKVTYKNGSILLINAYCLHEAPIVKEDTRRTFIRLSYTVREFDRLGNAHNPMFDYNWEMMPRNTQDYLVCPINKKVLKY